MAFNLILWRLKFKIKRSGIYFDEKCDLSTCGEIMDYNVLLSFFFIIIIKIIIVIRFLIWFFIKFKF